MKTAVLIPCYNEELTIKKVILDFKKALPKADIYVYDNNSTDNSYEIAKDTGAIVKREYRQGKGNVVRSMFRDIDADCYILVDGDDTYPAEASKEIEELILSKKADMVIGDRLSSTYFEENKRRFHNSGNKLVRKLINTIFNSDISDIMTGMRGFSYEFVKSFPISSKEFEIEIGTPPTTSLIMEELGIEKASHEPGADIVADLPIDKALKIARMKFDSLLANDYKAGVKEVMGTCVSMGLSVDGKDPREAQKDVDAGKYDDVLVE